MSEIASRKDGADEVIPRDIGEIPGIPEGEELALGPVEGDEIDPLPKWWDEPIVAERDKVGNRRLEDGVEPESPRRKPLRPLPAEDAAETGEEESAPAATPDPVAAIAEAEASAETPPAKDASFYNMPEIEAGTITVKRSRKSGEEGGDGKLSEIFADPDAPKEEAKPESADPDKTTTPTESSGVLPWEEEGNFAAPAEASRAETAPARKGPPPIPVKFDGVFEEKKPLIPKAGPPVKMKPPAAEAPAGPAEKKQPEPEPAAPALKKPVVAKKASAPEKPPEAPEPGPAPAKESAREAVAPEPAPEAPEAEEEVLPVESAAPPAEPAPKTAEKPSSEESEAPQESVAASVVVVPGSPQPEPEGKKETASPAKETRKAGCWTVFATLFFFATMLVLAGVVAVAGYAWTRSGQFVEQVGAQAKSKLAERGIHFDHGTWGYEFPRGIVFSEVTVYDDASKARPAIRASGLGVNLDLLSLATSPGAPASAEFSLRDSKVEFYQKGELFAEIEGVDGEILADAATVTVERLSALVAGLRTRIDGTIALSPAGTGAEGVAAPATGAAPASPFASLDFSGFRAVQPWLDFESEGGEPPVLALSFAMDAREPDLAKVEGSIAGGRVVWRGLPLESVAVSFRVDPKSGELVFPNLSFGHGGGLVAAALAVDMAGQSLKIERLQSTVDFVAMLPALDSKWAETFRSIRFLDAPVVEVAGTVPMEDPKLAELEIRYSHRHGLVYQDGERELTLSDIRGKFAYKRGALETNDASANLFGGQLLLNGATNLTREERPYTGLVEIFDLPLDKASAWFGEDGAGLSGRLDLTFRGTGQKEVASINGGGTLRIEGATLPAFPAVGPVQDLLGKVVPAFGAKGAGTVTGAYILESGVLVTSDLTVVRDGAKVVLNGSVNLGSKETNFVATADLEPALAAATGLRDKAIVVEGKGPLDRPELKLREFPVEFAAAGLGEVLGTTPETLGGLKELLESENAAETITGAIEGATGVTLDPAVGDLLKSLLGPREAPREERPVLRAIPQN